MIRTLIIEDEEPAAARLEKLLTEADAEIEIVEKLDSVESAVKWLSQNAHPQLLMLDIQLADGLSFDIFRKIKIESFVIFTTAFDEYAIKAFELNSIDYLLKPVDKQKLSAALLKFRKLQNNKPSIDMTELIQVIESRKSNYKKRFSISIADRIKSVETTDIACFYSLEKNTFLCTFDGQHFPIDFSLDRLESLLDPEFFFRISRQYFVQYKAISKIRILSKSRIELEITSIDGRIAVSSAKTHQFREWIDK
jgi:DNA-binding LytR/AlgR family response regulator